MNIPLSEFELHLPEKVLEQGLIYFQKGKVIDAVQVELGIMHFEVQGNELYEVSLEVQKESLVKASCTCVAALNMPVCKHAVAAMFFMEKNRLEDLAPKKTSAKKPGRKKSNDPAMLDGPPAAKPKKQAKTIESEVLKLLKMTGEAELHDFLAGYAKKEKSFRSALQIRFLHNNEDQSLKKFRKDIKLIVQEAKKGGYQKEWSAISRMIKPLNALWNESKRMHDETAVLHLRLALLIELMPVFNFADDSHGLLSDFWNDTFLRVQDFVMDGDASDPNRETIFQTCLAEFHHGLGFDFGLELLELASQLIDSPARRKTFEDVLDKMSFKKNDDYLKMKLMDLRYGIILQMEGEIAAWNFAWEHRENHSLRQVLLGSLEAKKDWKKYLEVAKEGAENKGIGLGDSKDVFMPAVIKALEKLGDTSQAREIKANILIRDYMRIEDWRKLKAMYSADEWKNVFPLKFKLLMAQKFVIVPLLLDIHLDEGMIKEFKELVTKYAERHFWDQHATHVRAHLPELYFKVYYENLLNFMKNSWSTDKRHFEQMASMLRNLSDMLKAGQVAALLQQGELNSGRKRYYQELVQPLLQEMVRTKNAQQNMT